MLDFAKWIAEEPKRFLAALIFIGACCYFISWPLTAIRGRSHCDCDDL